MYVNDICSWKTKSIIMSQIIELDISINVESILEDTYGILRNIRPTWSQDDVQSAARY